MKHWSDPVASYIETIENDCDDPHKRMQSIADLPTGVPIQLGEAYIFADFEAEPDGVIDVYLVNLSDKPLVQGYAGDFENSVRKMASLDGENWVRAEPDFELMFCDVHSLYGLTPGHFIVTPKPLTRRENNGYLVRFDYGEYESNEGLGVVHDMDLHAAKYDSFALMDADSEWAREFLVGDPVADEFFTFEARRVLLMELFNGKFEQGNLILRDFLHRTDLDDRLLEITLLHFFERGSSYELEIIAGAIFERSHPNSERIRSMFAEMIEHDVKEATVQTLLSSPPMSDSGLTVDDFTSRSLVD